MDKIPMCDKKVFRKLIERLAQLGRGRWEIELPHLPLKFETAPKILLYQTSSPAIQANTTDHQLSHAAPVPTDGYDPVLVERYFEALHYS